MGRTSGIVALGLALSAGALVLGRQGGPDAALTARVQAFGYAKGLSPEAAAKGWLGLYDALLRSPDAPFVLLVDALPAPESWADIAAGLRARTAGRKDALSRNVAVLAALLEGDVAGQWRAIDALGASAASLTEALARETGDRARLVAGIGQALSAKPSPGTRPYGGTLEIPDLVGIVGPKEAGRILLRALRGTTRSLVVEDGAATRALAQRLALAHVAELKSPQWGLVDAKSLALYEATRKRFGTKPLPGMRMDAEIRARLLYDLGLLDAGRRAEAVRAARALQAGRDGWASELGGGTPAMRRLGDPAFAAFLGEVVRDNPRSPFWTLYALAMGRTRRPDALVASLRRAAALPKLDPWARDSMRFRLTLALLGAGRVDEGLALMRKALGEIPAQSPRARMDLAERYVRTAHLAGRPKAVAEGLALARRAAPEAESGDESLTELLLDIDRPEEARKAAAASYVRSHETDALIALAKLDYRLDRPQDVRRLLDGAPEWGVRDVADFPGPSLFGGKEGVPMGFVAAWALAKTGEGERAAAVLDRALAQYPGYDPAYALLRELRGEAAIPTLDALYAADRFEERPPVWKAVALKDAGRLEEAEATVRQALRIDPSDAETPDGRRLFAYAVLADVRAARGDVAEAARLRDALASIRLSEQADRLDDVGLRRLALTKQAAAADLSPDAPGVQMGLAGRLLDAGRAKEAAESYRRAYATLPDELAKAPPSLFERQAFFEEGMAQEVAGRVLTALAGAAPGKPQVHALLGALREGEGRRDEAMAEHRKAVALDPDLLRSWQALARAPSSPEARRAVASAIFRLDPLLKRGLVDPGGDLPGRWRAVERALPTLKGAPLYPLVASAASLKRGGGSGQEADRSPFEALSLFDSPGRALVVSPFVRDLLSRIEVSRLERAAREASFPGDGP